LLDTADTKSFDSSDIDVTTLTPASTPGVSNDVVILGSIITPSDGGDGVIELSSALWVVHDSGLVTLERISVSFNSHGGWSLGNGSLKLGWRLWSNSRVRCNFDSTSDALVLASSVDTFIWIIGLNGLGVGFIVVESKSLETSLATMGNFIAVDELLLGEAEKISTLDELMSFSSGSSRESPA